MVGHIFAKSVCPVELWRLVFQCCASCMMLSEGPSSLQQRRLFCYFEHFHPLVMSLCIIFFTVITFFVNSLGFYRTWPRRLNHSCLLNDNTIQKWSRHLIWQLFLPHFVVHVTCAIMQWMLKNKQGERGLDICGLG